MTVPDQPGKGGGKTPSQPVAGCTEVPVIPGYMGGSDQDCGSRSSKAKKSLCNLISKEKSWSGGMHLASQ
jgi:hypothetical protein